jgi:DNA-directed RNA polymerase specialized sigma subunit
MCKNTDFNDKIISLDNKNNNNMGDNNIMSKNNLLNSYKRDIYQKIPLEDRKTELCQYLGMKKREYLDTILEKGMGKILPINKERSKITLLKIWYGCFEDGKLFISNGNNKIFSQKSEIIEMT